MVPFLAKYDLKMLYNFPQFFLALLKALYLAENKRKQKKKTKQKQKQILCIDPPPLYSTLYLKKSRFLQYLNSILRIGHAAIFVVSHMFQF